MIQQVNLIRKETNTKYNSWRITSASEQTTHSLNTTKITTRKSGVRKLDYGTSNIKVYIVRRFRNFKI